LFFDRRSWRRNFWAAKSAGSTIQVGLLTFVNVGAGSPALLLSDVDVPPATRVLFNDLKYVLKYILAFV